MKKLMCIIMAIFAMLSLSCCNIAKEQESAAKEALTGYFAEYENSNYEGMKQYCTDEFVDNFFHDSDVFGCINAKLLEFTDRKIDTGNENTLAFEINTSTKPIEGSANYDENEPTYETYIVYILEKQSDGKWLICDLSLEM